MKTNMKFRTKLVIISLTVILMPLVLSIIAFAVIGGTIVHNSDMQYGIETSNYRMLSDSIASFSEVTDELYNEISTVADEDSALLEDQEYLDALNEEAEEYASYIIVRKGEEEYYTGNETAAAIIFDRLPEYGLDSEDADASVYYTDMQKLVKQVDFTFSDGEEGSLFIVTRVNSVISRSLLVSVFVAIVIILVVTSLCLTRWIYKSVFLPITKLSVGMQNIAEGNLDYVLVTEDGATSEIGRLYANYDEMRMKLKESAEEKERNEAQSKELISNITHDLKTPITAIKGYVEGIMDGVADTPEKMERYIRTVYTKANELDRLINELTYYSGINSNRIPYHFQRINLAEFFQDCVDDVGLDLESKNIELNYSNMVEPSTRIIADPEQLRKVISNIIGNSVKYMDKPKGVINIRILDMGDDQVGVEIEDNGKGIAAKDLASIFERFYRTDASRNSSTGGNGIGLSIVKKIIEDHGGYCWATSKEGEGTCLHFVLRKYTEADTNE